MIQTETLDAKFYRERAAFCNQLAAASGAAHLLGERLRTLATSYEHRALIAEMDGDELRSLAKSYEHRALITELDSERAINGSAPMASGPPENVWDAPAVIEQRT